MPRFRYVAKDRTGKKVKGEFVGNNLIELYNFLDANGLFLVEEPKIVDDAAGSGRRVIRKRASRRDLITALQMFAAMLRAGMSLNVILDELAAATKNKHLANVFAQVKEHMAGGQTLAEAMERYPEVFDKLLVESIRLGELTGRLDDVLETQIRRLTEEDRLISSVKKQSFYPIFVGTLVLIVFCAMVFFFLPRMIKSYKDVLGNFKMPPRTRTIMQINSFIVHYGWIFIVFWVTVILSYVVSPVVPPLKRLWDHLLYAFPPTRAVVKYLHLARIALTLKIGAESGLPISQALQLARRNTTNVIFKEVLARAEEIVERGGALAQAFSREDTDHLFHAMLRTGEAAGTLAESMEVAVDYYTQRTEEAFSTFVSVFTYGVIILLGFVVAYTVLSVIIPIYELPHVLT